MFPGAPRSNRPARAPLGALACVAAVLVTADAAAHEVGLSRGDYVVKGRTVEGVVAFARREALKLSPAVDADHDGTLSEAEVGAGSTDFARRVFEGIVVERDGTRCTPKPGGARLVAEDGIEAYGSFACDAPVDGASVSVKIGILGDLSTGHRHLATLAHGGAIDEAMLHKKEPGFVVKTAAAGPPAVGSEEATPAESPSLLGFFQRGVAHVLTAWDHLAFLVALALVAGFGARRTRGLAIAVGALILAHGATLALSVFAPLHASPRIVGALVGLAVAYVGLENFTKGDPAGRWRVTLPFAVTQGFAAAAVLAAGDLPTRHRPAALLLFDLGTATGQVAALCVLAPLTFFLAKQPAYRNWGVPVASGAVVIVGIAWFVKRVAT